MKLKICINNPFPIPEPGKTEEQIRIEQLEKQLAEKALENKKFKYMILELQAKEQDLRHQICEKIRERIVKETCYDTEEEVRNAIYDFNAREVLEILDQIEKGE